MEIKVNNFKKFKQWSPHFKFLFFPMLILGILSIASLIVTSFWKYDLASAEFFARGLQNEFVKYWAVAYVQFGNTELVVLIIVMVMILIESFLKKQIELKSNGFWSKNRWLIIAIYSLIIVGWTGFNIYKIVKIRWEDTGMGPGVDATIIDSYKYKQTGVALGFVIQTLFLLFGFYYVHFKLLKKKNFWQAEYWIDAIKSLTFCALTYILIVLLKGMFSRPYYRNYIFGDLLSQAEANGHHDWVEHYWNQTGVKFGFNNGDPNWPYPNNWVSNIPGEWPWYKPNGIFNSPANMPQYKWWIEWAFPSGHINATYSIGTVFFLILGKDRKFNWVVKLLLFWFLLHLLSMNFALIVKRSHWISDLAFTHIWSLAMFPVTILLVNKIMNKILGRKK